MMTKNFKISLSIFAVIDIQILFLAYNIIFKSVYSELENTDSIISMAKNYMDNYPTAFFIQVGLLVLTLIPFYYFWIKVMKERKVEAEKLREEEMSN